jgi:NodT family efflux transporter outer membrane factor (OMF) lipoprotein
MAVYLGRPAAEANVPSFKLSDFQLPTELPLSLPSELVGQRPDVLMAAANLHAASAQVGVAAAARLPGFTLNGTLGGTSNELTSLLSADNILWSFGGGATQTIFDAGELRHRQKAAEAAFDQAKAQYRAAVLTAFQNTADVLQAVMMDAETLVHADRAAAAAKRAADLTHALFVGGQVGALPALNADAVFSQAEVTLIQARTARFTDTIGLYQALGGGWTSTTPAVAERVK